MAGNSRLHPKSVTSTDFQPESCSYPQFGIWANAAMVKFLGPQSTLITFSDTTHWMTLIPVQYGPDSGYLVTTTNLEDDGKMSEAFANSVVLHMRDESAGRAAQGRTVTVRAVDLFKRGLPSNLFLVARQAPQAEVACGYIPFSNPLPKLRPTESGHLAFVADFLKPGIKSEVDIYCFLPVNNRHLRLIRAGEAFSEKRIESLAGAGHKELMIKAGGENQFDKFYTLCNLNVTSG